MSKYYAPSTYSPGLASQKSCAKLQFGTAHPPKCPNPGIQQSQIFSFGYEQRGVAHKRVESILFKEDYKKIEFHNAEKLKHFEQLKASNIDDLNNKIQKLIGKLSAQDSSKSSLVSDKKSRERFKTDYGEYQTKTSYKDLMENYETFMPKKEKPMIQSKIITNMDDTKSNINQKRKKLNSQIDIIRKKYQNDNCQKQLKHDKSYGNINNNSKAEDSFKSHMNIQIIRFRQKLKENCEKQRKQLIKDIKSPFNGLQKQSSIEHFRSNGKSENKRNISDQLAKYDKRLESYNSKKLLALSNEGQIERVPLKDTTNNQSTYLKYSPFKSNNRTSIYLDNPCINYNQTVKPNPKLKIKAKNQQPIPHFRQQYETYHQDNEQPLTADFRQPDNELKLLLKNLMMQITLDEKFRNCKKWFSKVNNHYKRQQLLQRVKQRQLQLDETSIYEIFELRQQQQNPFFTFHQNQFTIEDLVQTFIQCEEHWFDNIVKKFNHEKLFETGFRQSKIDISNKGYLDIEDLVRFVNIEADEEKRNRDMFLIFERLSSEDILKFEDLIDVICY